MTLRGCFGFPDSSVLKFLRLSLSLEDGQIFDEISGKPAPEIEAIVYCILSGYADAERLDETCKLATFAQLPGGRSYENAFNRRAVQPLERLFDGAPETLYRAANYSMPLE